jgi:hypothetical protein
LKKLTSVIIISILLFNLFLISPEPISLTSNVHALDVSMDTSLSNASASFLGENANDNAGVRLAGAGDVNGDGYDDILIGAPFNDEGGTTAGQVYLIFGNPSGWSMDTYLSRVNASFIGENVGDRAGTVAGAGDVNNDGFDDILVGASVNDEGANDAGQVYLIFGKSSGWSMDTSLANADASFLGENVSDWVGYSLGGPGDVNGDGFDDILISAYESGVNRKVGKIYLIFGKASGWAMDTSLSDANASFLGEKIGDLAYKVGIAGDVNNDGFDDILVGADSNDEGGDHAGQVYLIFGKASGWVKNMNLSKSDASFIGENAGDLAGYSISGAGDVNNDGYDDFLIGAPNNDGGGSEKGQIYLIFGKASGWVMDTNLSNVNASFIGENIGDQIREGSTAGDVNYDGFDDIILAGGGNSEGGSKAGQVYLILGKASGWVKKMNLTN